MRGLDLAPDVLHHGADDGGVRRAGGRRQPQPALQEDAAGLHVHHRRSWLPDRWTVH